MDQIKKKLFTGVVLVIVAFICTVAILYFVINTHQETVEEVGFLKEEMGVLNTEKDLVVRKVSELEKEIGKSIYVEKLINKANDFYTEDVKNSREGYLWVDRNTDTYVVTLGALNGLSKGSRLSVYDGNAKVGYVDVETAMDVVSYVYPADDDSINKFAGDYYRVVYEE